MKIKTTSFSGTLTISILMLVFAMLLAPVFAQEYVKPRPDLVPPPSQERFADTNAVASNWHSGVCPDDFYKMTDCEELRSPYDRRYYIKEQILYNSNGSAWYKFGRIFRPIDYYKNNESKYNFLPFGGWSMDSIILRMVAESDHWYEVEVNVKTHATKYILKNDTLWEKKSWDFWLAKIEYFQINKKTDTEIYDAPNGEFIARSPESKMTHLRYLGKREGDWAFVQVSINGQFCYPVERKKEGQCYPGWVRWRDGWNFLVNTNPIVLEVMKIEPDAKEGYAERTGIRSN